VADSLLREGNSRGAPIKRRPRLARRSCLATRGERGGSKNCCEQRSSGAEKTYRQLRRLREAGNNRRSSSGSSGGGKAATNKGRFAAVNASSDTSSKEGILVCGSIEAQEGIGQGASSQGEGSHTRAGLRGCPDNQPVSSRQGDTGYQAKASSKEGSEKDPEVNRKGHQEEDRRPRSQEKEEGKKEGPTTKEANAKEGLDDDNHGRSEVRL